MDQYVDIEVERLTNNIVNKVVSEKLAEGNYQDLFIIDKSNKTEKIKYDTAKINRLKNEINREVEDILIRLDDGDIDEYFIPNRIKTGRFHKIKKGILCDISIGSVRNSALFANVGPTVPIKLLFSGQINSNIDVKVKEYGINNIMIEMYLVVQVKEQVTMPISSKRKKITIEEPISVEIVRGDIPKYYPFGSSIS